MRRAEASSRAGALLLSGCALPGLGPPAVPPEPVFADPSMTVESAAGSVTLGSGRQAVQARLGPAENLTFDNGYEVWVYRARRQVEGAEGPELVLLFDPGGRLSKLRVKPAYRGRPLP